MHIHSIYSSKERKGKVEKHVFLEDLLCHFSDMYNCLHFKEE